MFEVPLEGFAGETFPKGYAIRHISIINIVCLRSLIQEILLKIDQ